MNNIKYLCMTPDLDKSGIAVVLHTDKEVGNVSYKITDAVFTVSDHVLVDTIRFLRSLVWKNEELNGFSVPNRHITLKTEL